MPAAMALAGWLAAVVAALACVIVWRARGARMEAVARACHELRGPLSSARLGLELGARRGGLTPDRFRALDLELARAALALDDLDRSARARLLLGRAERVDVRRLLADCVEASQAPAASRAAAFAPDWSGPDAYVWGDRLRLAQAIGNVIANAVEHGGGTIDVRGLCERGMVRIEVIDGGAGLSAPLAVLIQRPRNGRGRRGRGLAIAASVAERHGGRLTTAPSKRGAHLVLELPAAGPASGPGRPLDVPTSVRTPLGATARR
ncbi:MAG: HAMP domain-containing histidine kinase [Solirubrobacterales bacterium]|nr:HAMP domain-containing histidine kinase [Solirubrobacterales bacterium]